MTYEGYRTLFIVAAVISAVMLVITVLLFIFLKIPYVIGDLSGTTARKAIKQIREQNEKSGDKGYKASGYNVQRGKLTDKISKSGNIAKNPTHDFSGMNTSKISTAVLMKEANDSQTTVLQQQSNETTVLEQSQDNETTVLNQQNDETTVLNNSLVLDTVQLSQTSTALYSSAQPVINNDTKFSIEYDITFIHTNEIVC